MAMYGDSCTILYKPRPRQHTALAPVWPDTKKEAVEAGQQFADVIFTMVTTSLHLQWPRHPVCPEVKGGVAVVGEERAGRLTLVSELYEIGISWFYGFRRWRPIEGLCVLGWWVSRKTLSSAHLSALM